MVFRLQLGFNEDTTKFLRADAISSVVQIDAELLTEVDSSFGS